MDVVHVGPDCLVLECSIGVYELVLRRRRLSTVCLCRAYAESGVPSREIVTANVGGGDRVDVTLAKYGET